MRTKLITIILISIGSLFLGTSSLANNELTIMGRIEGVGTSFEIKDSEYLNISLKSAEEIKVVLESIPKMISINIELVSSATSTILTLENLEPNKTYYKYQDSYKNEAVFISDEKGSYSWQQDLTQPYHIWLQEIKGTIFIQDNETGGDCTTIGIWDASTKTCTLTQNLTESVEIAVSGITLDCANYKVIGSDTGYGIYLNRKSYITIKNCGITGFSYSVFGNYSSNNTITNNVFSGKGRGVSLNSYSANNIIADNKFYNSSSIIINLFYSSRNTINNNEIILAEDLGGTNGGWAIYLYYSSNNFIKNNYIKKSGRKIGVGHGILLEKSKGNFIENNVILHTQEGIGLFNGSNSNIIKNNTFFYTGLFVSNSYNNTVAGNLVNNKPLIYLEAVSGETIRNIEVGQVIVVNSDNVTIEDLDLSDATVGIELVKTSNSKIRNNKISTSRWFSEHGYIAFFQVGIYLENSFNNEISNNNVSGRSRGTPPPPGWGGGSPGRGGINLTSSKLNILKNNIVANNEDGIRIDIFSDDNTIINNQIYRNYYQGLHIYYSNNNKVYHNNFINNYYQARVKEGTGNLFDNSYPSGGNYWSDYVGEDLYSGPNQDKPRPDGIGDTPYTFPDGQDRYPFMRESGWEAPSVPTYNVAVILAEPSDVSYESISITTQPCKLIPQKIYPQGHNREYYRDLTYCVADYHKENSFGTINLNFEIYDDDGGWFKTSKSEGDYLGKEHEFVIDAINLAINNGINLSNQDIVIVLHSGTSAQRSKNKLSTQTWSLIDHPLGYPPYKIIVAEDDPIGAWAHEIGHILGALFTPENTITPDLYNMGNIKEWDLMAAGSWNNGVLFNKGTNPPYISSYAKEFLKWLNYDIRPKSAYGEYWINSLETSEFGDKVFRYNLSDDTNDESPQYYILETRNRNLRTWDSSLPGLPVVGDKNLLLYYVDTKGLPEYGYVPAGIEGYQEGMTWNQYRYVTIPGSDSVNDGILNPLINETYRDFDNLVKFSAITDRTVNDKYEIQARVEEITNDSFLDKFWGTVLRPSSLFKQKVKSEVIFNSFNNSYYSANFQGIAMGNPCPSRVGYMAGIIVDIIPASQDIPSMKKDMVIIGPTGTYEGFLKSLDTPNSKYTAEDYRILQIKGFKSDSHEYVLVKKTTVNRWFLKNGDKIFTVFSTGSNCELYGVDFFTFNLFKAFIILLFILGFSSLFIYYSRKIGFRKVIKKVLKILLLIVLAIIVIFLIFLLLIYLDIISPQSRIISPQIFADNSISASFNPPIEPTTSPDLDLHFYCDDGRHVGVSYQTGEYEVQIPEAIVSGENQNAPEWIFIPKDITGCRFVVSSYDNQKFLEENPEIAQEIEDFTDSYEIYARYIDPTTGIYTSTIISEDIEPGTELEHPISGTYDITIEPGSLTAHVNFNPDTLNLKSKGKFVIVYIELSEGFDVNKIDISTIMLNDSVPALSKPTEIGDYDKDGIPDLMVKFERERIQNILNTGEEIPIIITGKVFHNGSHLDFKGDDIIKVIK